MYVGNKIIKPTTGNKLNYYDLQMHTLSFSKKKTDYSLQSLELSS